MNPTTVLIVDDDKNSLHLSYSAMSQLVAPENIHCAENAAQTLDILKTIRSIWLFWISICQTPMVSQLPSTSEIITPM